MTSRMKPIDLIYDAYLENIYDFTKSAVRLKLFK